MIFVSLLKFRLKTHKKDKENKMKNYLLMLGMLFFTANAIAASVAPPKVIGATTVDTMFAKKLFDKKTTFIDVRSAEDYKKGHIPRAINLSLKEDGFSSETLSAVVKKNKSVVFYCNGVTCQASAKATQLALDWGWTSVFYYRVGFPEWKRVGLEVE